MLGEWEVVKGSLSVMQKLMRFMNGAHAHVHLAAYFLRDETPAMDGTLRALVGARAA
jgi:hypothetical protein